jgi:uncharacterized protein YdeI (YjbR/CyaY-like superfamily)
LNVSDFLTFENATEWEAWLAQNHAASTGVWLKIARKGHSGMHIEDAGDVALCYGWIDSQRKPLDDESFLQRYTPRRPGAAWSRVNVERAERLIGAGRLRAPGISEVQQARADGRWAAAYESQSQASVPAELERELHKRPGLRSRFAQLSKTERYLLLLPLLKARTPRTRETRLRAILAALEG